jgi:hypothetical protein
VKLSAVLPITRPRNQYTVVYLCVWHGKDSQAETSVSLECEAFMVRNWSALRKVLNTHKIAPYHNSIFQIIDLHRRKTSNHNGLTSFSIQKNWNIQRNIATIQTKSSFTYLPTSVSATRMTNRRKYQKKKSISSVCSTGTTNFSNL